MHCIFNRAFCQPVDINNGLPNGDRTILHTLGNLKMHWMKNKSFLAFLDSRFIKIIAKNIKLGALWKDRQKPLNRLQHFLPIVRLPPPHCAWMINRRRRRFRVGPNHVAIIRWVKVCYLHLCLWMPLAPPINLYTYAFLCWLCSGIRTFHPLWGDRWPAKAIPSLGKY